jgi:hypothetical protein
MATEKNLDREITKERRRLGAFLSSLTIDEIEGIKKVLLSSLIEYERRGEQEKRDRKE